MQRKVESFNHPISDNSIFIIANVSTAGCYIVLPSVKVLYKFKVSGGRTLHGLFDMLGDANEYDKGIAQYKRIPTPSETAPFHFSFTPTFC